MPVAAGEVAPAAGERCPGRVPGAIIDKSTPRGARCQRWGRVRGCASVCILFADGFACGAKRTKNSRECPVSGGILAERFLPEPAVWPPGGFTDGNGGDSGRRAAAAAAVRVRIGSDAR